MVTRDQYAALPKTFSYHCDIDAVALQCLIVSPSRDKRVLCVFASCLMKVWIVADPNFRLERSDIFKGEIYRYVAFTVRLSSIIYIVPR